MKRIVCLSLLLFTGNLLKSQVKVVDFDPDIRICMSQLQVHYSGGNYSADSMVYLDIDSNGVNDLHFDIAKYGCGVYNNTRYNFISVQPMNDSKIAVTPGSHHVAEVFDSVDFTGNDFFWSGAHSALDSCISIWLPPYTYDTCIGKWTYQYDKYLSVRLINMQDTLIAFIRMDCDSNWCFTLKEYQYIPPPVGVQVFSADKSVMVSPNPTNGLVRIKSALTPSQIDIYTIFGQLVYEGIRLNELDLKRYVAGPGIFLLKISFPDQSVFRKVVLQ